jgi:nucleotide-binding universal stress UspA family protein
VGFCGQEVKTGAMTETMTPVPAGCVVVGVDGSEGADAALDWATDHARLTHRTLALVHGWDSVPSVWLDQVGADPVTLQAEIRAAGAEVVATAAQRVSERAPEVEVLPVVRHADARALLAGLAAHAEVTVVGSRGRGPISSLLLGSVSSAVAGHATGPVVVVRPGGPAPGEGRGVLVAVDGEEGCRPPLEAAYDAAAVRGLPLTVLHCTFDARIAAGGAVTADLRQQAEEEARLVVAEAVSGLAEKYPDVDVHVRTIFGHVESELLRVAHDADLVVVGNHRRNPLAAALLGSVSRTFLEHAHGAVMVVPEGD